MFVRVNVLMGRTQNSGCFRVTKRKGQTRRKAMPNRPQACGWPSGPPDLRQRLRMPLGHHRCDPAAIPATPPAGSAMPSGVRHSSGGRCAPGWRRSVGSRPGDGRLRPVSARRPCESPAAAWGAVRESGRGCPEEGGDQACTGPRLYFDNT